MSDKHTQGLLQLDEGYRRIAKADDGRDIFLVHEHGNAEANARRLVACWNALEDLPQAALDGGWTRAGLEAYGLKMMRQRDELLEALTVLKSQCELMAASDWRKWEELASPKEFERWVKSRAAHMAVQASAAIAKVEAK